MLGKQNKHQFFYFLELLKECIVETTSIRQWSNRVCVSVHCIFLVGYPLGWYLHSLFPVIGWGFDVWLLAFVCYVMLSFVFLAWVAGKITRQKPQSVADAYKLVLATWGQAIVLPVGDAFILAVVLLKT